MRIDVFTLFPQWFEWFDDQRHLRNAREHGHRVERVNYRDYSSLSGGQVDDTPFGGGAGMLLRVDVVDAALCGYYQRDSLQLRSERRVVALAASGRQLTDQLVDELARESEITLLCGRYEGIDQRVIDHLATDSISIGPYVLSGGEIAAMVLCDAVMRKLPGSIGHADAAVEESFSSALDGAPEYPHYTRPAEYRGWQVPPVLLSGHHDEIRRWRLQQSRQRASDSPATR